MDHSTRLEKVESDLRSTELQISSLREEIKSTTDPSIKYLLLRKEVALIESLVELRKRINFLSRDTQSPRNRGISF